MHPLKYLSRRGNQLITFWNDKYFLCIAKISSSPMNREYDLFEKFPDGSTIWRDFVVGLEVARQRLQHLAQESTNEFFAIHTPTKEIVARENVFDLRE